VPVAAPVLEINPGHALVRRFEAAAEGEQREDLALLLLEQAQLADGGSLEDPASFVRRVNRLLAA
jgi:molecular chaperone HtpG